jgi:hypothetical protein
MNLPLNALRVSTLAVIVLLATFASGCKSNPSAPDNGLTDADAATLIAAVYGAQSGGFTMQLGDAIAIMHGGNLPAAAEKKGGRGILRDTIVDRNRTVTTDGKTYAINYKVKYDISYTNNNFNNPRDYWYQGCKELRCLDTLFIGTMALPGLTATDSGYSQILLNNTDSTTIGFNGKFYRYGTYTLTGSGRTYTGRIGSEGIPGVSVDPATKQIVDGDIELTMKGKQADGSTFERTAGLVFRRNQQPYVTINGKIFILNTQTGEATAQ